MDVRVTTMPAGEGDVNLSPRRNAWQENLSGETKSLLQRDEDVFLRQSLSSPCLDVLVECKGTWLTSADGRRFMDFHGNSLHQLGHAHPEVVEAVKMQLDSMAFCPRRFANEPALLLAEKLREITPGKLGKTLLAPGATSAMGIALKIARTVTGRFKTVSMWDSFHGASLDACSVGGEALFRSGIGPLLPGTEHVPPPEPYRCVLGPKGGCDDCDLVCAKYLEYVLEKEGDVGAVVAEALRCTTVNVPPKGFWTAVRKACDKHGALLIMDETATCLGRTGRMFACEHFDVVPDMLVMGKGLGGGIYPLAAVVVAPELDVNPHLALGHYTHEKNPTACAAALAGINIIQRDGLVERSRKLGALILERLQKLQTQCEIIGEVRGLGLSIAVELVLDRKSREKACVEADQVMYRCLERGLAFKTSHGNVLTLTPPLNISDEDLESALRILEESIVEINSQSNL